MSEVILVGDLTPPPINEKEIMRYARAGGSESDRALLLACLEEALPALRYHAVYRVCSLRRTPKGLDLGFALTDASSLIKHLDGCQAVIVVALTLGMGMDRLLMRYKKIAPARAWMLDAIGNERIESLADALTVFLAEQYGEITKRYSPGYGDLPLSMQRDIFSALSLTKQIGLCLSEGLLMTPEKSVTALIGVKNMSERLAAQLP